MSEKVVIGGATLYRGDCRDLIVGGADADLIVTDAPYRLTAGGRAKSGKTMSGIFAGGRYANDGCLVTVTMGWPEMMDYLYLALKTDGDCYVMANDKNLLAAQAAAHEAGFGFHNMLVWEKPTAVPNRWYMKNLEFTLYLWKGRARTIADPGAKQITRCPLIRESDHPTEKPVALMAEYVRQSSEPGDLVLDPFMGAGSTGVAALRLGRRFVGCEIEARHFDTACARMEAALDRPELFAAGGRAP